MLFFVPNEPHPLCQMFAHTFHNNNQIVIKNCSYGISIGRCDIAFF